MPSSIYFRGQNLYDPQVVVDVNNQLLSPENLGSKNLCVVGEFPWLEPQKTYVFRTDGGPSVFELYGSYPEMMRLDQMWKRSIRDSQQVSTSLSFVNACDPLTNLQASGSLQSRADDPATAGVNEEYHGVQQDIISLKSVDWGRTGNNYSLDLAIDRAGADLNIPYTLTFQEPGQPPVVQQIGSGAVLNITADVDGTMVLGRAKTGRQIVWTPSAGSSVTIDMDDVTSMDNLVDRLNLIPDVSAVAVEYDYSPLHLDAFSFQWAAAPFDAERENLHVKNHVTGTPASATAHVQAIVDLINQLSSIKMNAEVLLFDNNLVAEQVVLAGGSNGVSPDKDDYEAALAAVVDKDIQIISCLLEDNDALRRDVAAIMKSHLDDCLGASTDRQAYMPCDEDTSIDDAYDLYVRPNTDTHMAFVPQGIQWENRSTKARESLGSQYTAFLMMCIQGALPYAEPISRKIPNILNTSESWDRDNRLNINKAIRKSLVIISKRFDTLKINRGVTSWIKDNDTINMEMSARESVLGCARFMRIRLDQEIGGKILASTKDSLKFIANQRLKELVDVGMIAAFDAVKVSIVDDTAFVEFDIAPVNPLNFIKVTINVRSLQELLDR